MQIELKLIKSSQQDVMLIFEEYYLVGAELVLLVKYSS